MPSLTKPLGYGKRVINSSWMYMKKRCQTPYQIYKGQEMPSFVIGNMYHT
jgi:hypothetical protein